MTIVGIGDVGVGLHGGQCRGVIAVTALRQCEPVVGVMERWPEVAGPLEVSSRGRRIAKTEQCVPHVDVCLRERRVDGEHFGQRCDGIVVMARLEHGHGLLESLVSPLRISLAARNLLVVPGRYCGDVGSRVRIANADERAT